MARITRPLTNTEVHKAKPADKDLSLDDGDGLFLLVKPSGKKLWRFRYKQLRTDKRTMIALGSYPAFSLGEARQMRDEKLALLARGIDPQKKQKQHEEEKQIAEDSFFLNVALKWFALKERKITQGTAQDVWRSIEKDVLPSIGNTPIQELKARTLIQTLEPVKTRGALETFRRLVQRINEIMTYAVNTCLLDANPASGIRYAFEQPKKQHMPTIRPEELPQLMRNIAMSNLSIPSRCLLEWQLLTLIRHAEASSTAWAEIDFEKKEWVIPAARMKTKRDHVVPLSKQALEILEIMKPISRKRQYVFPSCNDPKKTDEQPDRQCGPKTHRLQR